MRVWFSGAYIFCCKGNGLVVCGGVAVYSGCGLLRVWSPGCCLISCTIHCTSVGFGRVQI